MLDNISGTAKWALSAIDVLNKEEVKPIKKEKIIKKKQSKVIIKTPDFSVLSKLIEETNNYYKNQPNKEYGDILIIMNSLQRAILKIN